MCAFFFYMYVAFVSFFCFICAFFIGVDTLLMPYKRIGSAIKFCSSLKATGQNTGTWYTVLAYVLFYVM